MIENSTKKFSSEGIKYTKADVGKFLSFFFLKKIVLR